MPGPQNQVQNVLSGQNRGIAQNSSPPRPVFTALLPYPLHRSPVRGIWRAPARFFVQNGVFRWWKLWELHRGQPFVSRSYSEESAALCPLLSPLPCRSVPFGRRGDCAVGEQMTDKRKLPQFPREIFVEICHFVPWQKKIAWYNYDLIISYHFRESSHTISIQEELSWHTTTRSLPTPSASIF